MRLRNVSVNFCFLSKNKMLAYRNFAAKVSSKYHYFYTLIFIIYFSIHLPTLYLLLTQECYSILLLFSCYQGYSPGLHSILFEALEGTGLCVYQFQVKYYLISSVYTSLAYKYSIMSFLQNVYGH